MYQRLFLAIFVGLLTLEPTFGQETGESYPSISTNHASGANNHSRNGLRIKGVLISESSRTALIAGRPVQEGDRIGGAEVVRIEQQAIRLRMDAEEFTVKVGGTFAGDSSAPAFVKAPARPAAPRRSPASPVSKPPVSTPLVSKPPESINRVAATAGNEARVDDQLRHAVQAGETLSGIALRYLRDGISVEQMMMAVFESNPGAFSDNINVLYAGTTLSIPSGIRAASQDPTMAAAAVAQHLDAWRNDNRLPVVVAAAAPAARYGPVESGETLSAIAASVLQDGVTLDQMMIALFEANPQAFSNNINVLYEGAVLRLPNDRALLHQVPEAATAEVARQTRTWLAGVEQQPTSDPLDANIMAAAEIPVDQAR